MKARGKRFSDAGITQTLGPLWAPKTFQEAQPLLYSTLSNLSRGAVTVPLHISRRDCLVDTALNIAAGLATLAELRADHPSHNFYSSHGRDPCHVAYTFVRRRAESLGAFFAR